MSYGEKWKGVILLQEVQSTAGEDGAAFRRLMTLRRLKMSLLTINWDLPPEEKMEKYKRKAFFNQ